MDRKTLIKMIVVATHIAGAAPVFAGGNDHRSSNSDQRGRSSYDVTPQQTSSRGSGRSERSGRSDDDDRGGHFWQSNGHSWNGNGNGHGRDDDDDDDNHGGNGHHGGNDDDDDDDDNGNCHGNGHSSHGNGHGYGHGKHHGHHAYCG